MVLEDGRIAVWVLGAPAIYTWDPATQTSGTLSQMPALWSPNGQLRAVITESGTSTRVAILGVAGEERASMGVTGFVSHLRWSVNSNQIVFTLNTSASGGGVSQDLYAWEIRTGSLAVRLTQDLRSRGGEYRGAAEIWKP